MVHRLSQRALELRPEVLLVLPTEGDRAPLGAALALASGQRGRLRAVCLRRRGEELPPELRVGLYGLASTSEADRAIRHLVDASVRGAHVPIRPLADLADGDSSVADPRTLIVGWSRDGELPDPERLAPLLARAAGTVILLVDRDTRPPVELLALMPAESDAAIEPVLCAWEQSLPVYRVPIADAQRALVDCTERTLVVAWRGPSHGDLESAVPGRLAVVLEPSPDRATTIIALLAALSEARERRAGPAGAPGSPPPTP